RRQSKGTLRDANRQPCDQSSPRSAARPINPATGVCPATIEPTLHAATVTSQRFAREHAEVLVDTVIFCPGRHEARLGIPGGCPPDPR
ncbi:MAG TPA: hypothetical protein VE777_08990, partial [Gaiellales bacterium]|nr:hypothetical protein [Gaiellales bacterium]